MVEDVVNEGDMDVVIVVIAVVMSVERIDVVHVLGDLEDDTKGEKEPFVRDVLPGLQVEWGCKLDVRWHGSLGGGDVEHL